MQVVLQVSYTRGRGQGGINTVIEEDPVPGIASLWQLLTL